MTASAIFSPAIFTWPCSIQPSLKIFLRTADGEGRKQSITDEKEKDEGRGRKLICRACGTPVTETGQRIEVSGKHSHTFFNPGGHVFELGCFRTAPGCAAVSESSTEFAWFAGYAWRVGVCTGCLTHIGWRFQSGDDSFYGLILKSLVEG